MNTKGLVGQEVTLHSSRGPIRRVVVGEMGEILLVCTHEERRKALAEGRKPAAIGFKKGDMVKESA